ncbi:nose resistant to fluoxetine protein 6 [Nephila pilipes]|uniref:Nose resistant to fluoxetine protein 6 n=1 Tax=Nephila pilipes TaxID=299642 RepID=A0A8X6NNG3_NEPPI|nr:nose resistant to fluoxetine protein 6 [Nephila pilipes]
MSFSSGLLTSYTVLKIMDKTKGKINVPIYIFRRYIRLTPPLLLTIGLLFFLPLISSGPFWYERVDPEIKACTEYWWMSVLYISNWADMKNIVSTFEHYLIIMSLG